MSEQDDYDRLEDIITTEIELYLKQAADDLLNKLNEIQPPSSIIKHAARAAAQVMIAFERGYRMPSD